MVSAGYKQLGSFYLALIVKTLQWHSTVAPMTKWRLTLPVILARDYSSGLSRSLSPEEMFLIVPLPKGTPKTVYGRFIRNVFVSPWGTETI